MTIGIAAIGIRAGEAVLHALQLAERVGQGAIRGFVSYAAIDADGHCLRYYTQNGGSSTLCSPDPHFAVPGDDCFTATRAALMSSAANRPEPLSQFVMAGTGGCLVTGHRLPNARRGEREAINERILRRLERGEAAEAAASAELAADVDADAGVIALDQGGRIFCGNTERVGRRLDLGQVVLFGAGGSAVAVLHNAISPVRGLAELVAQAALDLMEGNWRADGWIEVTAGTPLLPGSEEAVYLAPGGNRVEFIRTTDASMLQGRCDGAAVYLGATVYRGDELLGYVLDEPYTVVEQARVVTLDGRTAAALGYRTRPLNFRGIS